MERAEPELATFGRERFEGKVVFHATLTPDGSPRLHPVSPWFGAGLLCVIFRGHSPKVDEVGARTIAFPAISTGAFGYPMEEAAPIAIAATIGADTRVDEVRFVLFGGAALASFTEALGRV